VKLVIETPIYQPTTLIKPYLDGSECNINNKKKFALT
jgi:hypothetical protein